MRHLTDVQVNAGVIHIVNPREERLATSDAELDLGAEGVAEFLVGHVTRGLADPKARAAAFDGDGADSSGALCRLPLVDPGQLVAASTALAERLYEVSRTNRSVSDGTLAVLRCTAAETDFVALLKLDPAAAFRAQVTQAGGQRRVTLEREDDILPSIRERLQKAAFVPADGADTELLVVDRQRAGLDVSRFFLVAFLGAHEAMDAVERTRDLYERLTNAKNDIASTLSDAQRKKLDVYIEGQLAASHVDIDDLVDRAPLDDDDKERLRAHLAGVTDREVDLDEELVAKLTQRQEFVGDAGLRVLLPSKFDRDKFDAERTANGGWRVEIRTERWEEVAKQ